MNNNDGFLSNHALLADYLKIGTLNININHNQNDIILSLSYKELSNEV